MRAFSQGLAWPGGRGSGRRACAAWTSLLALAARSTPSALGGAASTHYTPPCAERSLPFAPSLPARLHAAATAELEPDGERKEYSRGLQPYVFVPFEQVATHVLNLPPAQMDFYAPG